MVNSVSGSYCYFFFFSSRRRHTRLQGDWSSDVCSSDLYPEPWLRPRVDTDLLIRGDEQAETAAAFERMGFSRVPRPTGAHVTHQFTYKIGRASCRERV